MEKGSRTVIVGGGASGVLLAAHLRRRQPDARITMVDSSDRPGTGAAYGTPDPCHLLNVAAHGMSAWPDDPGHFLRWLEEHAVTTADGFAPRLAYARYLKDQLDRAEVRLEHGEAVRLTPGTPARITLADGRVLAADAVALATGRGPGGVPDALARALAPAADAGLDRLIEDPWLPGALARIDAARPKRVLVVGSGLTGVDVALRLLARNVDVTLISRHGELPRRHRRQGPPSQVAHVASLPPSCGLDEVREAIRLDMEAAQSAGFDWRQVVDALRPHTSRLWQSLSWSDQRRFQREDLRNWEVLRHRMPPRIASAIDVARDSGRLAIVAGEVVEVHPAHGELVVSLSTADGPVTHSGDMVVVATGGMWDRRTLLSSPLWASLLDAGHAVAHPSGLGVRTDGDGQLIDGHGSVISNVICLGAIRQGELWESTAIPEIRVQAAAAAVLLAAQPSQPRVRTVAASAPRRSPAESAYAEGVRRLLGVQQSASRAFAAAVEADPGHARAHAALALIATERPDRAGGPGAVTGHLTRARQAAASARSSADDRSHVEAVAIWCEEGSRAGTPALVEHLERVPDDALALMVMAPSIAFAGAGDALPDIWDYVDRFASVHGEAPWYLGLLAYGRTEQARFFDAADLAEAALEDEPDNGNAAHARAHVHYETDAHSAGLRWLVDWIASDGRTQRYRAHFQWHAALHELAIGDAVSAARRYTDHLAPPHSRGVRCLVDAGSLAWRARLHPDWIAPPDPLPILAEAGTLATAPPTAFIAIHALLVHAANNDVAAIRSLEVPGLTDGQAATLTSIQAGLAALLEEQPRRALDHLLEALPGLPGLGGSRAQQEVVLETALAAMLRLGAPGQAARLLSRHRSAAPTPGVRRDAVS